MDLTLRGYAPGVDEEVTDRVDMTDTEYEDTYGMDKNGNPVNDMSNPESPFVPDATDDAIRKYAQELGIRLNNDTKDYLYQSYLQSQRDEWAFNKSLEADSTRYQRAVEDMKKAGLNPMLAMQSISGGSASASGGSISSGSIASQKNTAKQTGASTFNQILQVLGIIAGAMIYAMA